MAYLNSKYPLLVNASATGSQLVTDGGDYIVSGDGAFGGATLQLQLLSPDGSSWLNITDGVLTSEGSFIVTLGRGDTIRMAVVGGAPSALYCDMKGIR